MLDIWQDYYKEEIKNAIFSLKIEQMVECVDK